MSRQKIIVAAVALGVALVAMYVYNLSFRDLVDLAKSESTQARSDYKALVSGEYTERMARKMREESEEVPPARASSGDDYDGQLNHELTAERQRLLKQRAEALNERSTLLLRGDVETLKRQVEKQARQAGEVP